jgi:hypothetical protein
MTLRRSMFSVRAVGTGRTHQSQGFALLPIFGETNQRITSSTVGRPKQADYPPRAACWPDHVGKPGLVLTPWPKHTSTAASAARSRQRRVRQCLSPRSRPSQSGRLSSLDRRRGRGRPGWLPRPCPLPTPSPGATSPRGDQRHVAGPATHIQHPHPRRQAGRKRCVPGEGVVETALQQQAPDLGIAMAEVVDAVGWRGWIDVHGSHPVEADDDAANANARAARRPASARTPLARLRSLPDPGSPVGGTA